MNDIEKFDIEKLNARLGEINGINQLTKELKIPKSTFYIRLRKCGLRYSADIKQIVIENNELWEKTKDMNFEELAKQHIAKNDIEARVAALEQAIGELNSKLEQQCATLAHKSVTDDSEDFELSPRVHVNDIITRSIKVHKNIMDQFLKLCDNKKLRIYSKQDLISQALLNFIEDYR